MKNLGWGSVVCYKGTTFQQDHVMLDHANYCGNYCVTAQQLLWQPFAPVTV